MHSSQTLASPTVLTCDAAACGRILVVDDDRAFGAFLLEALQTRGHDVDWAGCLADGVASLFGHRYDLLILDLRLPDGTGLELLRHAIDQGVIADSAAIILTGHDDFDEPSDIRVFRKPVDLDPFLDRMGDIVAATKRRRPAGTARLSAIARGVADERMRVPKRQKIELVLYTSAESEKSVRAIRAVRQVLDRYDQAQVSFSICDLSGTPSGGENDAIVFTPTLVKKGPGPKMWIIGNLDNADVLVDLLEVSGVDRKRDR